MSWMEKSQKFTKPKLPRKRKKACIKEQGRNSYRNTIRLAEVTGEYPCKFWVNSSVKLMPCELNGTIAMIPTPTRYW